MCKPNIEPKFPSNTRSSILFNAKFRVVSVLVHFLRIRNIICPLITIFCELFLFHGQSTNMSGLQSKILHQSNAQLLPTILYGLAAIMLYAIYDRYLMEIRLIFDYLTLSLRCTRGLSPLEEQTYICEAINLHACRETMVLEQREKMDRDLKEMLRREKERIRKEQLERSKHEKQRLQNINYVSNIIPQLIYFIRTVFGMQKITIDEENIPPSIRTGIEKQKDELRICAAKTMCCSIQKHFKDKNSILPNCLQGISRAKINLCDLKEKDLCNRTCGGQSGGNYSSKLPNADICSTGVNNVSSIKNTSRVPSPSRLNAFFSGGKSKKEEVCIEECRQEEQKKKGQEKTDAKEKCDPRRQGKCDDQKKRQKAAEDDLDENNDAVSIFNDLPRTDLVMSCEIKRVLDPDCQEVLRCKEVIVPPPICAADKAKAAMLKKSTGIMSPVGAPFGTATNCNQMGMAQRLQPMYQCANNVLKTSDSRGASCSSACTSSCSTCQSTAAAGAQCGQQNRGRQMDGMFSSMPSVSTTSGTQNQIACCEQQQTQKKCDNTCARMLAEAKCQRMAGSGNVRPNKTSVQAIPVQVTMTETNCNYPRGAMYNSAQMGSPYGHSTANSFSNAGAATPLEAQNTMEKRCTNETVLKGDSVRRTRFANYDQGKTVSQCQNKACLNANCSGIRRDGRSHTRTRSASADRSGSIGKCCGSRSSSVQGALTDHSWAFGRSSSVGAPGLDDQCCIYEVSPGYKAMKKCFGRSNSLGATSRCCGAESRPVRTPQENPSRMVFNDNFADMECQARKERLNQLRQLCSGCKSGLKNKNSCKCGLRGGAEETQDVENEKQSDSPSALATTRSRSPNCSTMNSSGPNSNNNKLTETKREVFKTVTNIDDPSGKVIRKECDKVIEEILHSSDQPGETKTMREVTVETNIIQEANKTIREESHNTREEIINYEMDSLLNSLDNDFENRKQRIDKMRMLSGSTNRDRHVSEERHIFGRFRGSPDMTEVQSEAAVRSRVDTTHKQPEATTAGGGLKGGNSATVEKRGQSTGPSSSSGKEATPTPKRSLSAHSPSRERSFEKGDYCRDFNSRLEASPYGQKIRELKDKLFTLKTEQEMNQTLEQIVCLQTEALMSFIPKQEDVRGKTEERKCETTNDQFNPDLSYSALMKELKSAMKSNRDSVSVARTIKDMDRINAEIERDMKIKMGSQQYLRDSCKDYPNHYAFANLIKDLREKTKDYEDGVFSSRSDEDCESTELRRQRIEVLRDELEKRKQMLGLEKKKNEEAKVNSRIDRRSCSRERTSDMMKKLPVMLNKIHGLPPTRQVTIREPHEQKATEKSNAYKKPCDPKQRKESGHSHNDNIHRVPPAKELIQCSKEACKSKKTKTKSSHKTNAQVAFQDQLERMSEMSGLPQQTNVKQIVQSMGHLLEMVSRAKQEKTPRISMTIKPRKANLSQDSDVTAVMAQTEATRLKTPTNQYRKPCGKLLGGGSSHSIVGHRSDKLKMPKTPSSAKMGRNKGHTHDPMPNKRLTGVVKQIKCTPYTSGGSGAPSSFKVDQKTNDAILSYLRARGHSIQSPSSILFGSHSKMH